MREEHPCLREGSLAPLGGGHGWIAYGRFSKSGDCIAVACNNLDDEQVVQLRLRTLGIADGRAIRALLCTGEHGFSNDGAEIAQVSDGVLEVLLPAKSALVMGPAL
jgi:hypothetical protein